MAVHGMRRAARVRRAPPCRLWPRSTSAARSASLRRSCPASTHQAPQAIGAACVVAAMASWALEGVGTDTVLGIARSELDWVALHDADLPAVSAALAGEWQPPTEGVGLDAAETVAAVVHVVRTAPDLATALPMV